MDVNRMPCIMTMLLECGAYTQAGEAGSPLTNAEKALLEEWSGRVVRRYEFD
jgi:hypothetical protein